jgi:hypothetical protein
MRQKLQRKNGFSGTWPSHQQGGPAAWQTATVISSSPAIPVGAFSAVFMTATFFLVIGFSQRLCRISLKRLDSGSAHAA